MAPGSGRHFWKIVSKKRQRFYFVPGEAAFLSELAPGRGRHFMGVGSREWRPFCRISSGISGISSDPPVPFAGSLPAALHRWPAVEIKLRKLSFSHFPKNHFFSLGKNALAAAHNNFC
jgi:hypothetical protein